MRVSRVALKPSHDLIEALILDSSIFHTAGRRLYPARVNAPLLFPVEGSAVRHPLHAAHDGFAGTAEGVH
jgi:hypothetical protein